MACSPQELRPEKLWNPGGRAMARVPEPGAQLLGALSRINLKWDGGWVCVSWAVLEESEESRMMALPQSGHPSPPPGVEPREHTWAHHEGPSHAQSRRTRWWKAWSRGTSTAHLGALPKGNGNSDPDTKCPPSGATPSCPTSAGSHSAPSSLRAHPQG